MIRDPVTGQRVICCDPKHDRCGWVGVVRGWNSRSIGVQFPDDPACPPTGRWLSKNKVVALDDADEALRERVRRVELQRNLLAKARESALAAVDTYNRPTASFRSGSYIVLMVIAWTSLLLAIFVRRGADPRYEPNEVKNGPPDHDSPGYWDLSQCLREYYKDKQAATAVNLRFFIGLRNHIEHGSMPWLDASVFGECQAMLLNFEEVLAREFGEHNLLTDALVYSLQFSRRSPAERQQAMRSLPGTEPSAVLDYVERFRSSLSAEVRDSQEFSFRVFLIPQLVNHQGQTTAAIEWVHYDPSDPDAMEHYEHVVALIKTKHVAVANKGRFKPADVCRAVSARLVNKRFSQYEHMRCWRHYGVRPPSESPDPECCKTQFCCYDEVFRQYVYTQEWVERLVSELADDARYREVCGKGTPSQD
jgi:hypothetical protein